MKSVKQPQKLGTQPRYFQERKYGWKSSDNPNADYKMRIEYGLVFGKFYPQYATIANTLLYNYDAKAGSCYLPLPMLLKLSGRKERFVWDFKKDCKEWLEVEIYQSKGKATVYARPNPVMWKRFLEEADRKLVDRLDNVDPEHLSANVVEFPTPAKPAKPGAPEDEDDVAPLRRNLHDSNRHMRRTGQDREEFDRDAFHADRLKAFRAELRQQRDAFLRAVADADCDIEREVLEGAFAVIRRYKHGFETINQMIETKDAKLARLLRRVYNWNENQPDGYNTDIDQMEPIDELEPDLRRDFK